MTIKKAVKQPEAAAGSSPTLETIEIPWPEVAAAIFAARGIDDGLWHLGLRIEFAALTARTGPEPDNVGRPIAVLGLPNLQIAQVETQGPMVFRAGPKPSAGKPTIKRRSRPLPKARD